MACNNDAGTILQKGLKIVKIASHLEKKYPRGFVFDTTSVRLLSEATGFFIDRDIEKKLKQTMFKKTSGIFFLLSQATDKETRSEINKKAIDFLEKFNCFELSILYDKYIDRLNINCISSLDDFEAFFKAIFANEISITSPLRIKIVRLNHSVTNDILLLDITKKLLSFFQNESVGAIQEDELQNYFPNISTTTINILLSKFSENIIKTEINGIVCYQTFDTIGLPDDFSDMLCETLSLLDDLKLTPTVETIHTAISLRLSTNFSDEYNIRGNGILKKIISYYYKNIVIREWIGGEFKRNDNNKLTNKTLHDRIITALGYKK